MKTNTIFKALMFLPLILSSCSAGGKSESQSTSGSESISSISIPSIPSSMSEEPKPYTDTLPENSNDGVIFHAFCWTYKQVMDNIEAIANAGYKNVQISPVQQPKGGGSKWWQYYQPCSFAIAKNSNLGSKDDLKALCDKAEEYNVSVIADIVINHMANISDNDKESDGTPKVAPEVETYEPEIYRNRNNGSNPTFHHNPNARGSGAVTQVYPYGNLPDLNTANTLVQDRVLSLFKECIDVGIDGFRFDAAKHVETPDDPDYASNFWPNTLGKAKEYYKQKTNHELLAYGEILGDPDGGRKIDLYTKLMRVTETNYIDNIAKGFDSNNLDGNKVANASFGKNAKQENFITWVESHDTYISGSYHPTDGRMGREWAVLAARKGTSPLFFARPDSDGDDLTVGKVASTFGLTEPIGVVNRFHNRFVGAEEYQSGSGPIYVNERVGENDVGALIVNMTTRSNHVTTNLLTHLPDGVYYDGLTGKQVNVYQGCADFDADSSGVVCLTKTKSLPRPSIEMSENGGVFVGQKTITIKVTNALSAHYTINDGTPVSFTGSTTVNFGDGTKKDYIIDVTASNGEIDIHKTATFNGFVPVQGKFNVVNINPKYFTDYDLLLWKWKDGQSSSWTDNYTVKDGVLLFDTTGLDGFLLGLFAKGKGTPGSSTWGSPLKQSGDISKKNGLLDLGFYDASGF